MAESVQVAQHMVDFLAFFMLPFIIFLVVEWVLSLFRRDS